MSPEALKNHLRLEPHPREGGFFRRVYRSNSQVQTPAGPRYMATAIYYLLTSECRVGLLHKNASDILHFFQGGSPLTYYIVTPEGQLSSHTVGPDLGAGQVLQLLVPGGHWKASELTAGDYGLVSEVVVPGFEYADNVLASAHHLSSWPEPVQDRLRHLLA